MPIFNDIILKIEQLNEQSAFQDMQADIHIAFGIDKNFARGMGILIEAIHSNNIELKIVFHVFTDGLDQSDLEKLKNLTGYKSIIIKIYYVDINVFKNLPTTLTWSCATYYRFIMGSVLYGIVDKVLYMDADILCVGSIAELKNIEMDGNIVLAISEGVSLSVKRLALQHGEYFNAGVLYIDINKWNVAQIGRKAVALLMENPEKYPYLDQDVLNILLDGKTSFIDRKWNYLYDMRRMNNEIPNDVKFIHFICDKPWQRWSKHHFMAEFYDVYARKSPWASVPLIEPRNYKEKKRMAMSYAKRNMYMKAVYWYVKYGVSKIKENVGL